jgi:hypothetical protein
MANCPSPSRNGGTPIADVETAVTVAAAPIASIPSHFSDPRPALICPGAVARLLEDEKANVVVTGRFPSGRYSFSSCGSSAGLRHWSPGSELGRIRFLANVDGQCCAQFGSGRPAIPHKGVSAIWRRPRLGLRRVPLASRGGRGCSVQPQGPDLKEQSANCAAPHTNRSQEESPPFPANGDDHSERAQNGLNDGECQCYGARRGELGE